MPKDAARAQAAREKTCYYASGVPCHARTRERTNQNQNRRATKEKERGKNKKEGKEQADLVGKAIVCLANLFEVFSRLQNGEEKRRDEKGQKRRKKSGKSADTCTEPNADQFVTVRKNYTYWLSRQARHVCADL